MSQDSVCRLLMRVQPMQASMVQCLLGKITEHSDEEVTPNSLINLLINQFRWMDFLADCSSLVTGLLETLSVAIVAASHADMFEFSPEGDHSPPPRTDP